MYTYTRISLKVTQAEVVQGDLCQNVGPETLKTVLPSKRETSCFSWFFSGSHHRALKSQQWQNPPRKWHILQECKNGPFLVDLEHFWVPRNYSQITRLADVVSLIRSSHSSILNTAHHEISSYFGSGCPGRNFSFLIFTRSKEHLWYQILIVSTF